MIGLVIAGAEKLGWRSKPAASVPDIPPKPATLEEELAAMGISVIPLEKVRYYQVQYLKQEKAVGRAEEGAFWDEHSVGNYKSFGFIPPGVAKRIAKVETIPGARVSIERFEEDPFVFVSRREENGWSRPCCFDFWDAPGFKPENSGPEAV